MSARYRLALAVEFSAGDDPAARATVTRNIEALEHIADSIRGLVPYVPREGGVTMVQVKCKLQRLNDDAPPRALVVETL